MNPEIFPDDHAVYSSFANVGAGLSSPSTVATSQFDLAGILDDDYYIGVIVDPLNNFGETDDTNNKGIASATFNVTGGTGGTGGGGGTTSGADLVIDSVVFDSWDDFTVSFSNNGSADASTVELSAFLSGNTTLDAGDPIVFNASVDGNGYFDVAAGATGTLTIAVYDLDLSSLVLADGIYYLITEINPDTFVAETDYTNNTGYDPSWGVPIFPADSYEPDIGTGASTAILPGSPQTHSLTVTDIDWFSVMLNSGTTYTIETSSPGGGFDADTYMYLYAADGATLLGEDDDGGTSGFSQLTLSPSSTGTFYIAIEGYSPIDGGYYQLSIVDPNAPGTIGVTIQ